MLGAGGAVARVLGEGYEERPQQLEMASAVARALAGRGVLLSEAGTGVGKSFAYLAPAMERIASCGERVVVATHTIALQEQLISKDIPVLLEAFGDERIRPVLVKGRGNYLSIRRLALASARQELLIADAAQRASLRAIEDWAYQTDEGTLSTLPVLDRPETWDLVRSDADNCMGRKCPHFDACFYQRARREAERANLLICNHALFFADLALRAEGASVLPNYQHVILDEAHAIEDVASEHFGLSLGAGRVFFLLRTLFDARRRKGFLASLRPGSFGEGGEEAIEQAIMQVRRCGDAARAFFDAWLELERRGGAPGGRIRKGGLVPNGLSPALRELALRLAAVRRRATREEDAFELMAYQRRAMELAEIGEALCEQALDGCVYWLEVEGLRRGGTRVTLRCAPVEVREALREHLFGQGFSVVLTSATLATRREDEGEPDERAETAFAFTMERLGCEGAQTLQVGSPFEYARQVKLYVDRSMPAPADSEAYARALVPRILDHVAATDGGAFCLFTSHAMLARVADMLGEPLAALGHAMLVQGREGSRSQIVERFRSDDRSVLLGTASFWQGIDIRGRGLRNVIITRLPFEPPGRPLTEARMELIRARGEDPFRSDAIPRAVIRFKQGFGRLIRSQRDTGRVVVLDPRLVTAWYGRFFLKALPEGVEAIVLDDSGESEG